MSKFDIVLGAVLLILIILVGCWVGSMVLSLLTGEALSNSFRV